eukprot:Blabericola_migrator_1__5296@NODE_2719_length_2427_cov_179_636017_g1702_i0_p1_GENE_NODE_2719_length_2427_cov_179_636017_g1702_i0NODE_2719_length_2427_cov_179_636017_g1702_i0_p1_ORF_typecomplete_len660_score113_08Glyco_tranf_2_3/PF13641_6/4_3e17Glycos_transf_2/PF00535_26/2_4e16Glyco_transf_7C/PF02709_14/2_8e11Ricin_B_lectin/PF00652_22/4e03Ricin_B_lectin/PF00652_22/2_5e08Glyco_tranf_2_2/PF10111_9/3_6e06CDtoxinA/PF03498_14/0_0093_NODE_2719_length_2427_cov_179_636017_g1702_i02962275
MLSSPPPSTPASQNYFSVGQSQSTNVVASILKRLRWFGLNLQTLLVYRLRLVVTCLLITSFLLTGVWFIRAVDTLEEKPLQDNLIARDLLSVNTLEGQKADSTHTSTTLIPDSYLYPLFPDRPSIFSGVDDAHLHGKIGLNPSTGEAFWKPMKPAFRMTKEQKREAHKGYCFNTRVSASLELDRQVPNYNSQKCLNFDFSIPDNVTADVVVVFHNEDLSVLLRSIHSILNRTPPRYLNSIILVNDDSNKTTHTWLFDILPAALETLPKTKLIHLTKRRGLMMARMEGTKLSTSPITVYLDSHIECSRRWLEPMLYEINKDPKTVVTPFIHSIDPDNFEFEHGAVSVVGFTWTLGQSHPHRPSDGFTPIESPVMAGGLFAINREWFLEMGGYDPEMKLYGGEEMEIGFKTWQCGGSMVALPCSRIGHVFRTDKFWKGQVYPVPFHEIIRNKRRTAEVWLDEYKKIAFMAMSDLPEGVDIGPLDEVRAIREKLQCKPFSWYLERVFPELNVPKIEGSLSSALTNNPTNVCLDTLQNLSGGPAGPYACHGLRGSQSFLLDGDGKLLSAQSSFAACLEPQSGDTGVQFTHNCSARWKYEVIDTAPRLIPNFGPDKTPQPQGLMKLQSVNGKEAMCLAYSKNDRDLRVRKCDPEDQYQLWQWVA